MKKSNKKRKTKFGRNLFRNLSEYKKKTNGSIKEIDLEIFRKKKRKKQRV